MVQQLSGGAKIVLAVPSSALRVVDHPMPQTLSTISNIGLVSFMKIPGS